ncbi:PREDICTED: uncharacterized protein LOC105966858 isoform X2 [Erythranthe guttata]|uniref:uncharacterized protein LOC105966858 isoform X2 n=1 Tax=Erythranthe guttata TaxID=4155 RepID=UPI00064DA0B5|nr:PREDICTED: uncharacterized protein LOC105966858 isoform X2 [Erythranthe guttata]|eukprot:XP_012846890.1 PREDICTED: uncharacterized protein LOC105966858 isoform X2 [Erythranthe guttata]
MADSHKEILPTAKRRRRVTPSASGVDTALSGSPKVRRPRGTNLADRVRPVVAVHVVVSLRDTVNSPSDRAYSSDLFDRAKENRLLANAKKRLAYASLDAGAKRNLLVKQKAQRACNMRLPMEFIFYTYAINLFRCSDFSTSTVYSYRS